jgi:hypothetical protein
VILFLVCMHQLRIKVVRKKASFYKELECVFDQFLKYHMKILLEYFNKSIGRKDIFKPTLKNER